MKFKGILSIVMVLCMLFSIQSLSAFAEATEDTAEEVNIVTLFSSFNGFEGEEMTTEDNENFVLSVMLEAGSYQFTVDENGTKLSHPTTVKDTTAKISSSGILLSDTVNARCTLLATGGNYTFEYNTGTDLLKIKKDGTGAPADNGEYLKIKTSNQEITTNEGAKITYNVYLKADEAFEDIQAVLNFDESKLALTSTTAETCCPALIEASFNTDIKGLIAVNSSNLDGYDFTEEKLLLTLEFTAVGTGEAYIDFTVQAMTVLGGEKSYFFLSKEETEGAVFRETLETDAEIIPTTSTEPSETQSTEATNPTATISTTSTEPSESMSTTEPSESMSTEATNPTETIPATAVSSDDQAATVSTEPSETSTDPKSTTVPASEFELGDVNRDGKLNIRDATLIQKALAKLEQLDNDQLILADYLTDGKVNIKDATQIQKKLANLI